MVGIAVVSCDENNVIMFDSLSHNLLYAAVNASYSLYDSVIDTGVADHVAVCVVEDDEILLVAVDSLDKLLGYDRSTHLRLKVICRNLRRRNQDSVLILERSLAASIEEESYMSIFLSLCDTQLTETCI